MYDLLDYDNSFLNPTFKIIIPLVFLGILWMYQYVHKHYSEKIRKFIELMLMFAFFSVISGLLSFYGDGIMFGFTSDYSLKWFQSLTIIAEAICFLLAGHLLLNLFEVKTR